MSVTQTPGHEGLRLPLESGSVEMGTLTSRRRIQFQPRDWSLFKQDKPSERDDAPQIGYLMQRLNGPVGSADLPDGVTLPVANVEAMHELEEKLRDDTTIQVMTDHSSRSRYQQETPRQSVTVQDSLPDRRSTIRRLTDSLRRCQDRLGTCNRLPYSLRRCQTVSQTGGAHAGDSQTVCNGAKTVSQTSKAPARDS
ncbi:hypothetical protein DPMN_041443 [Dreissena polymorpha]|uniref:Uncharacterized protein n=1 Tax=Dreissena polymorpha TaxID=45954 RepID=A0A9D4CWX8_DREPO|nr:hypothetical protein DPMN_041443 [Dreissena polymorpha]